MNDGYQVDPTALTAAAEALEDAARGVSGASATLHEGAGDELGPAGIAEALRDVVQAQEERMRRLRSAVESTAAAARAASTDYPRDDCDAAEELRDVGGEP